MEAHNGARSASCGPKKKIAKEEQLVLVDLLNVVTVNYPLGTPCTSHLQSVSWRRFQRILSSILWHANQHDTVAYQLSSSHETREKFPLNFYLFTVEKHSATLALLVVGNLPFCRSRVKGDHIRRRQAKFQGEQSNKFLFPNMIFSTTHSHTPPLLRLPHHGGHCYLQLKAPLMLIKY